MLRGEGDFELNRPRYPGTSVLLTRENFDCGSLHKHLPPAPEQYGIPVLVGSSFAHIFLNNCVKSGLLPTIRPGDVICSLVDDVGATEHYRLTIDPQALGRRDAVRRDHRVRDRFLPAAAVCWMDATTSARRCSGDIAAFEWAHGSRFP
jgi:3-isopropylmalate/(R)-2-methylmalate dehydratase small subunit